jgi:hypothetical protein
MARAKRTDDVTNWLLRAAVSLACFLAHRQLSSIETTLEKLASKQEAVAIDVATLKQKVSGHDDEIYKRGLPRP